MLHERGAIATSRVSISKNQLIDPKLNALRNYTNRNPAPLPLHMRPTTHIWLPLIQQHSLNEIQWDQMRPTFDFDKLKHKRKMLCVPGLCLCCYCLTVSNIMCLTEGSRHIPPWVSTSYVVISLLSIFSLSPYIAVIGKSEPMTEEQSQLANIRSHAHDH